MPLIFFPLLLLHVSFSGRRLQHHGSPKLLGTLQVFSEAQSLPQGADHITQNGTLMNSSDALHALG